jgi:trehalose/maltose transport system permease protein
MIRWRRILRRTAFALLVAMIVIFSVFPFLYAVTSSMKVGSELFDPVLLPPHWRWRNYANVLGNDNFLLDFFNSVVVALAVVVISLLLGVTAAYALGRVRFHGRRLLLLSILGISMFPQVAVLSGLFELIRALGIYNTIWGLILAYMLFTLPFTVWVLTTFMRQLPHELEEAAIVDGASPWVIVTRIFMPLLWPALVTTGLLAFMGAWNEFLYALTFTISPEGGRTVPVAIAMLAGSTQFELPWGTIMAASVLVTLPVIGLVVIFQRRIVSGLTAGAIKG